MATYKVKAPDGREVTLQGPEGADEATLFAKAKALLSKLEQNPEGEGIKANRTRGGGPGYKAEAYEPSNLMKFSPEEDATIREVAGDDPKKEFFLRIAPTIEWRGNPEGMRSRQLSPAGAAGAFQFMVPTAKAFGVSDRFNFNESAHGAGRFYDELNRMYKGNVKAMLAHYNGGTAAGRAVMEGREPPKEETREYLRLAEHYGQQGNAIDTTRRAFTTTTPEEEAAMTTEGGVVDRPNSTPLDRRGEVALAAGDAALMLGTGAAGMAVGGVTGLLAAPFIGMESAAKLVNNVADFLTWSPKTDMLNKALGKVAPAAEFVDTKIKDASMFVAAGNPEIATALETGGNALTMLLSGGSLTAGVKAGVNQGFKAGVKAAVRESPLVKSRLEYGRPNEARAATIKETAEKLTAQAEALGVELDRRTVHQTVRQAAEKFTDDTSRGASLPDAIEGLRKKHAEAKAAADAEWEKFRSLKHFTDVTGVDGMVAQTAKSLAERGLMSDKVREAFGHVQGLRTQITTMPSAKDPLLPRKSPTNIKISRQTLAEVQAIRNKLVGMARDAYGTQDGVGISEIGKRLDDMLEGQFMKDAALGIDAPWEAWKSARETWSTYKKNWNENKAVKQILEDPEMTPEKLAKVILGSSSMLGSHEAGRIYKHIMKITDNNPELSRAIHSSIGFDLMKPLLTDFPPPAAAFRSVANNIGKMLKENNSLVEAMSMDKDTLRSLQHAARVAEHTEFKTPAGLVDWVTQGLTRFTVGHGIAQAGFKVRVMQRMIDWVVGKKRTSHTDMLKEFAGIVDEPISAAIPGKELLGVLIRGELASQYQDLGGDWENDYAE